MGATVLERREKAPVVSKSKPRKSLRQFEDIEVENKFEMFKDLVLLRLIVEESSSAMWTPEEPNTTTGKVLKVGAKCQEVSPGDMVAISEHQGAEVQWEGRPALILHEHEILAVIGEEE